MTDTMSHSALLAPLFASEAMRAVTDDRARLQRMLDFEAALARAQGSLGAIPALAIDPIARACRAERYDVGALAAAAALAGDTAAPLIDALAAEVATIKPEAAGYVHWGASSQDVIDTAQVLELRAAIDVLMTDLDLAIDGFVVLANRHRRLPTVARDRLQHTAPIPFGLKLAGYAAALGRSRDRLKRLRKEALALQFGGASGTLASLGDHGFEVAQRLSALLELSLPDAPWHSHRDRLAEVASAFAILAGTCGKIARDVALLMQSEIGEAFEPATARNPAVPPRQRRPVVAVAAVAAATLAPNLAATLLAAQVQDHEGAAGAWQAEWSAYPALAGVTSSALAAVVEIARGLEVDPDRMRSNIEATNGLFMADAVVMVLAERVGKAEARALVAEASRQATSERKPLERVLCADPHVTAHVTPAEIGKLFEPMAYQGSAQAFLERQLAPLLSRGKRLAREERQPVRGATAPPAEPPAPVAAPAPAPAVETTAATIALVEQVVAAGTEPGHPAVSPPAPPEAPQAPAADTTHGPVPAGNDNSETAPT